MIDTASGWGDLATYTDTQLLAHLDSLRQRMAEADRHSRIVEVRTFELRIADATRALAIHNRRATEAQDMRPGHETGQPCDCIGCQRGRATEAQDQQVGGVLQADVDALLASLRFRDDHEAHALVTRMWTALQVARPALTADEVRAVVREAAIVELTERRYRAALGVEAWKIVDAIAARVADKLAGRVVSEEQRDRIVTIADEAFGLGPVEPLDATLTRIERGISEQHRRLANLEIRREPDLREAFRAGAGMVGMVAAANLGDKPASLAAFPSMDECDEAAAEYARSKAGL